MSKLDGLRARIGDELTDKLVSVLDEKEIEAMELGMTPKEKKEEEKTPETEAKAEEGAETSEESTDEKETDEGGLDVTALAGVFASALQPFGDQIKGVETQLGTVTEGLKEVASLKEIVTKLQNDLQTVGVAAKEAKDGVAELKGDLPKGQKRGYRASADDKNVTAAEKEGPGPDPLSAFISDFALAHNQPNA